MQHCFAICYFLGLAALRLPQPSGRPEGVLGIKGAPLWGVPYVVAKQSGCDHTARPVLAHVSIPALWWVVLAMEFLLEPFGSGPRKRALAVHQPILAFQKNLSRPEP